MKLDHHLLADIFRLRKREKKKYNEIAAEVGVSERTVRRYLNDPEAIRLDSAGAEKAPAKSSLDMYADLIRELHVKYGYRPGIIHNHLKLNKIDVSQRTVQRYMMNHFENSARVRQVYNALVFEPGEAAQTDFGECGTLQYGGTTRKLSFCVTVLCRSRFMYAEIIPCQKLEHFLSAQKHAFEAFGGVPRKLVVDNCKCAVLSHGEGSVVLNPGFADFCAHYSVEPVACTPRRPRSKGIVERMVGYIKHSFLEVNTFSDIREANARLAEWLAGTANVRRHKVLKARPSEVFETLEKGALFELPKRPYTCERTESRIIDSYGRVSFEGNFYSVPGFVTSRQITLKASPEYVSIYYSGALAATHARSYDTGQEIIDPAHVEKTRRALPAAMLQDARSDFLRVGGEEGTSFLLELAKKGTREEPELLKLNALIRKYGQAAFREALHDAVEKEAFRTEYLDWLLTQPAQVPDDAPLFIPQSNGQMDIVTPETNLDIYTLEN